MEELPHHHCEQYQEVKKMSWDSYMFNQAVEPAKEKRYYVSKEETSIHGYHSRFIDFFSHDTLEEAKRYAIKNSPHLSTRGIFVIYRYVGKVKPTVMYSLSMDALDKLINGKGYIRNLNEVLAPVGEVWNGKYHSYLKHKGLRPRY